jgi:hypothetical protein
MNVTEFLKQLKHSRTKHGYEYQFGRQIRLVPTDDDIVPRYAYCIRHHDPEMGPKSLYPIEIVWHCLCRKKGDPYSPGTPRASKDLGLSQKRVITLMAAGEEYYLSSLDKEYRKKVRALRRDILKACGLEEVRKRPLPQIDKRKKR